MPVTITLKTLVTLRQEADTTNGTDPVDTSQNPTGSTSRPQVQGVVIYGALTGALVLVFLVFVLVLFLQRRRQRLQLAQWREEEEAARRRRRRRRRRAGLRSYEIDAVAPELVVGGDWETTSDDEGGENETGEVSTVAKLGSVEEGPGGRKRDVVDLEEEVTCAVCLEQLGGGEVVRKLPCEHIFHSVCIHRWAKRANKCPCCLRRIVEKRRKKSEIAEEAGCDDDGNAGDDGQGRGRSDAGGGDGGEGRDQGSREADNANISSDEIIRVQRGPRFDRQDSNPLHSRRESTVADDDVSLASLTLDRNDAARLMDEVRRELQDPEALVISRDYSSMFDDYALSPRISQPAPIAEQR